MTETEITLKVFLCGESFHSFKFKCYFTLQSYSL